MNTLMMTLWKDGSEMTTREEVMGCKYPSATRLSRMFVAGKMPEGIPEHILANASAKGTAVHRYAELAAIDKAGPQDAEYFEYEEQVDAFLKTIKDEEIVGTEIPFIDHKLKVKGFIDLLTKDSDGAYHVYDYKTSSKINDFGYPIQLQVYMAAVDNLYSQDGEGIRSVGGYIVHLTKSKFKLTHIHRDNKLVKSLSYIFGEYEDQIRKADR